MEEDLLQKCLKQPRDIEINANGTTYLDHAGAPLPAKSLLNAIFEDVLNTPYGNPHSTGGKVSITSEKVIEESRSLLLEHLGLSRDEYEIIFTSGATASIKLVGECFPWTEDGTFWYSENAHTSILGLRPLARNWKVLDSNLFFSSVTHEKVSEHPSSSIELTNAHSMDLVAIPGECNFSGAKLSFVSMVEWLKSMKNRGRNVLWLLDAAKLCASSHVDLSQISSEYRPHFICLSCYKIFGYPTGVGALLMRKDVMSIMRKKYFGGGTLLSGAVDIDFAVPRPVTSHAHFEDGTLNIHGIAAIRHGFQFIKSLGGMVAIERHTFVLMQYLLTSMLSLVHHSTNLPLCLFYSHADLITLSSKTQGPVINFNLQYTNGDPVGFHYVNQMCTQYNIQIRTGCFCNLGGCQKALQFTGEENRKNYQLGRVCSDENEIDVINHRNTGACRVSLGYGSTKADCDKFITFLTNEFLNKSPPRLILPPPPLSSSLANHHLNNAKSSSCSSSSTTNKQQHFDHLFWQQTCQSFPVPLTVGTEQVSSEQLQDTNAIRLIAMFVYPIKSCAGIRVDHWPITTEGLLFDRYFAIVNESGKVINQKQFPQLALIQSSFHTEPHPWKPYTVQLFLHIQSVYMETTLSILLEEYAQPGSDCSGQSPSEVMTTEQQIYSVCGRSLFAQKVSHDADAWFTEFLHITSQQQQQSSIVASVDGTGVGPKKKLFSLIRASSVTNEPPNTTNTNNTSLHSFVNTAQYLLLSIESVMALIQMIRESQSEASQEEEEEEDGNDREALSGIGDVKVENFRPNLIVTGTTDGQHLLPPHAEDHWTSLSLPTTSSSIDIERKSVMTLRVTGPCSRCSMVNVNGKRGIMDCRVFEALRGYRKHGNHVYFGQFLTLDSTGYEESDSKGKQILTSISAGGLLTYSTT